MHSDDGLKARIEEAEKDLLFYLRKYHELTSRSKFMKAVVDKEIKRLEKVLLTRKVLPLQARGGVSLSCVTQKTE